MLVVFCLVVRITGLICIYRQNHEDVARLNNIHNIKREKVVAMDVTWVVLCVRWWCTFNGKLCSVYRTSNYPEGRDGTKLHKSISQAAAYHQVVTPEPWHLHCYIQHKHFEITNCSYTLSSVLSFDIVMLYQVRIDISSVVKL